MRDLYELGDLHRAEYVARRDAINAELSALTPAPIPDLDQARQVLEDFTIFWTREAHPTAKRQFLSLIFENVWLDHDRVVAVQPKPLFLPFFQHNRHPTTGKPAGVKYGSDGGQTRVRHHLSRFARHAPRRSPDARQSRSRATIPRGRRSLPPFDRQLTDHPLDGRRPAAQGRQPPVP